MQYLRKQIIENCKYLFPNAQPLLVVAANHPKDTSQFPHDIRPQAVVVDSSKDGKILVEFSEEYFLDSNDSYYTQCHFAERPVDNLFKKTQGMVYEKLEAQKRERELRVSMLDGNDTIKEADSEAGDGDEPILV